jgi:hypothetical protein
LGSATLTGDWFLKGDTLYLKADQYLFNVESHLICKQKDNSDSTIIQIGLLRKYFKNQRDTSYWNWLVKIDNETKFYETNDKGILKIPYRPINQITVRDYLVPSFIEIKDSVFKIDNSSNDIKIYLADNKSETCILWENKTMITKWRKLISILPDSLNNTRPDEYYRVKRKCGNIKNE